MSDVPERSAAEVKNLLRHLDPKSGGHKDRVRMLQRFRNYVTGIPRRSGTAAYRHSQHTKVTTPEFYDDDIPLLLLGSQSPTALYDDDLSNMNLTGLLQACGTPSQDHSRGLKRSARPSISLLKFLVCDFVEMNKGKAVVPDRDPVTGQLELNAFAQAVCVCTPAQLRLMNLDRHVMGDSSTSSSVFESRGGSKEDACAIAVLLFTRHLAPDGETPEPLAAEDLFPSPQARKAFDDWLTRNTTRELQQAVKKKIISARSKTATPTPSASASASSATSQTVKEESVSSPPATPKIGAEDENDDAEKADDDVLGVFKSKARRKKPSESDGGDMRSPRTPHSAMSASTQATPPDKRLPVRWADSILSVKNLNLTADTAQRESERERTLAEAERQKQEEEKARLNRRDPLGIRADKFDLSSIQVLRGDLFDAALKDIDEETNAMGGVDESKKEGPLDHITSLEAQRSALESILERARQNKMRKKDKKGAADGEDEDEDEDIEGDEDEDAKGAIKGLSVVPTDPDFDPLLFLTLVHRSAGYEQLQDGIERLDSKTDNQLQRLQSLVRDNFALFVRCADGIEVFTEQADGDSKRPGKPGVRDRLDTLDSLADSCSNQAKKSFKPLLDNTNEVRKVQSALRVLHRIGPYIIQAPFLMKQHIENGRFSSAIKVYRRVLVIENDCNIKLFLHVKRRAQEAAREARRDLEATLADSQVPVETLLDAIRDLGDLIELDIPEEDNKSGDDKQSHARSSYTAGDTTINVRNHPPALACLHLQSAHFSSLVQNQIRYAESTTNRIYGGEGLAVISEGDQNEGEEPSAGAPNQEYAEDPKSDKGSNRGNRWRYDILEARVMTTIRAVEVARTWLPRLLRVGAAAREAEKRRMALVGKSVFTKRAQEDLKGSMKAYEVFSRDISPAVAFLVEHATFCALGCSNSSTGEDVKMSFGHNADEQLQSLLRAPLPPSQSAKVASELAELVAVIQEAASSARSLRRTDDDKTTAVDSPLESCTALAEDAVVSVEKRRCIYAFDVCARSCSLRASGSGSFDGDALVLCVNQLSEELTRPEECATEIEKGCELVVRRCCEGLASYVRDRGDAARLRAVAECADALNGRILDVVREVAYLTNGQCESMEETLIEDILALEGTMFDEYLDNIRRNISTCTRLGVLDLDTNEESDTLETFPPYLSKSLLAIVRCRAQVERALGETTVRRSQGTTYQFLAMATAADCAIDGICFEVNERMSRMPGSLADRMSNELQFLINTLRRYLSDDMLGVADSSRRKLLKKAGRGGGVQGDGPDGLAAIEDLERLGRVYVLCLSE